MILFNINLIAQNFYDCNLNTINGKFIEAVRDERYDLAYAPEFDDILEQRLLYYLNVVRETSLKKETFSTIFDSISASANPDTAFFGNPKYFSANIAYPDLFIYKNITGEMMAQLVYTRKFNNKITDMNSYIASIFTYLDEYYKMPIPRYFMKIYKNSYITNKAMHNKKSMFFDSLTKMIIKEEKVGDKWVYETMIYNLVIISKSIRIDETITE